MIFYSCLCCKNAYYSPSIHPFQCHIPLLLYIAMRRKTEWERNVIFLYINICDCTAMKRWIATFFFLFFSWRLLPGNVRCCWYCLLYILYCTILDVYRSDFFFYFYCKSLAFSSLTFLPDMLCCLLPLFFKFFYRYILWLRDDMVMRCSHFVENF